MASSLFIFAQIRPKPQFLDAARNAILGIMAQTRAEAGCQVFILHQATDEGLLYLYEGWDEEDALAAHHSMPYTREVFGNYKEWLAEPPSLTRMMRVS